MKLHTQDKQEKKETRRICAICTGVADPPKHTPLALVFPIRLRSASNRVSISSGYQNTGVR